MAKSPPNYNAARKRRAKEPPDVPKEWETDAEGEFPAGRYHLIEFADPDQIFELAKTAPLRAAQISQQAWSTFRVGHQENQRKFIAATYAIAYYLIFNEHELQRFFSESCWGKKKPNLRAHKTLPRLLNYVFRYMVFLRRRGTENRAYVYAASLQHDFNKGTKPEVVRQMLLEIGPEAMRKAAVKRRREEKEAKMKPKPGELSDLNGDDEAQHDQPCDHNEEPVTEIMQNDDEEGGEESEKVETNNQRGPREIAIDRQLKKLNQIAFELMKVRHTLSKLAKR